MNPKKYVDFDLNPDLELAEEVHDMLKEAGFNVQLDPTFEQIHDT